MPNHYHLVLAATHDQLSAGMRRLNGRYAQRFNRSHGLDGHLFQGRFNVRVIESERHLLEAVRYVVLNPVRAGLCEHPRQWRWSSYRALAGLARVPGFLERSWVLGNVDPDAFAAYVEEVFPVST